MESYQLAPASSTTPARSPARSAGSAVLSPGGRHDPTPCLFHLPLLLALTAPASAPLPAPRPSSTPDVEILVNGVPQTRYAHDGRWYVEALKGREYAIRLRNPYPVRVAVALSVDGLNTIDARETTASRRPQVGARSVSRLSPSPDGRRAASHARAFEFTTEERSYGQALGKTAEPRHHLGGVLPRARAALLAASRSSRNRAPSQRRRPHAPSASDRSANKAEADEYAATGMGRRRDHAVEQVWLDLEEAPAASVNIRYEFRPQLARLGVIPPSTRVDPLRRRERARGFEPGFAPEIETLRR